MREVHVLTGLFDLGDVRHGRRVARQVGTATLGYDELKKPVKKPLEGIKFAGYVGCQTNRPFGCVFCPTMNTDSDSS